jgi:hypothetical protein
MYDKVQGEASIHNIGSLTVSIPLSITLIIIFPFRGGRLKPAIHTAHSDGEINAAFGTNALSSFNSCPQHRRIPLLQTSSRSKKGERGGGRALERMYTT